MLTDPAPAVAVPMSGGSGTVAGATLADAAEAVLVPNALLAVTVQVTPVPLVRPLTTIGEVAPVLLCAPQLAVKPEVGLPPSPDGSVNVTVTAPLPPETPPINGALGAVA